MEPIFVVVAVGHVVYFFQDTATQQIQERTYYRTLLCERCLSTFVVVAVGQLYFSQYFIL